MAVCELASNSFVTNLSKIQHLISFFKLDECEIIKVFFHPLYLIQTIWNHCVHHLKHQIAGTHYFLPPPPNPLPSLNPPIYHWTCVVVVKFRFKHIEKNKKKSQLNFVVVKFIYEKNKKKIVHQIFSMFYLGHKFTTN